MKKELEIKAKELRKKGYSINELSRILIVSKSTISKWVNNIELSPVAIKRIAYSYSKGQLASQKTIQEKMDKKNLEADNFALDKLQNIKLLSDYSILICSMIYQCEGNKSIKDSITFTNSDPELIKTFLYLFRKSFNLDENKFRVLMHLHQYHNDDKQKKFWSQVTKIPPNQFLKTFNKANTGIYKKENYQGCVQIRYRDVQIGRSINAVAKKFMERYK
jgi:transcriptional regulator with XRE-family HTH domain